MIYQNLLKDINVSSDDSLLPLYLIQFSISITFYDQKSNSIFHKWASIEVNVQILTIYMVYLYFLDLG